MEQILSENPLVLLFIVAAIGYMVGKINIKGNSLGVSAVLFVGLAFGASNANYNVPEIVFQLGIVLFVYSIGLSSGPAFFKSFKKNGWRDISFVVVMLTISLLCAILLHFALGYQKSVTTGIYSGSTTNTPALASVIEHVLSINKKDTSTVQQLVLGYTYSYPMGILGVMIVLKMMESFFKIDYEKEAEELSKDYDVEVTLTSKAIEVTADLEEDTTVRDLYKKHNWAVNFGRVKKSGRVKIMSWGTTVRKGDVLIAIGGKSQIEKVRDVLGHYVDKSIIYNTEEYDVKTIFVSNPDMAGKELSALNLRQDYDSVITRIRRGDVEMLAKSNTVLELGDRIRFVAKREDLKDLSDLFGDSYQDSSQINLFSFGLGLALGLVLGLIEVTLPGGIDFKLGLAGGPLIVGLILGAVRRTGPIVWTLPFSSNVTLRQIGIILTLSVIGLTSGNTFVESILDFETGAMIFLGGVLLSMAGAALSIFIGYKLFKIPFSLLIGFLSNQPAILEYGLDLTKNRIPLIGYALMYPIALVLKVLYAQILYLLL